MSDTRCRQGEACRQSLKDIPAHVSAFLAAPPEAGEPDSPYRLPEPAERQEAWRLMHASLRPPTPAEFVPLGVIGRANEERPPLLTGPEQPPTTNDRCTPIGRIEINLPSGARVRVDAPVNEQALARVLRALKATT